MSRFKTPLRYPGGKQKIAPFVRELLRVNDLLGTTYVEPYAGGAGVAMELLVSGDVSSVYLNDVNASIAAFWKSVINQTDLLCHRISRAILSVEEWRRQQAIYRAPTRHSQIDVAFSALYLNRCNRSGIFSGGLIGGLSQDGDWRMDARFPRVDLINRIEAIGLHRKRVNVFNLDAEEFLSNPVKHIDGPALVYCDPPYFNKADRLYTNFYKPADHSRIAKLVQTKVRKSWLVSYDNVPEIGNCYHERRSFSYYLQYTAASAYVGREVFFFSDDLRLPEACGLKNIDFAIRAA